MRNDIFVACFKPHKTTTNKRTLKGWRSVVDDFFFFMSSLSRSFGRWIDHDRSDDFLDIPRAGMFLQARKQAFCLGNLVKDWIHLSLKHLEQMNFFSNSASCLSFLIFLVVHEASSSQTKHVLGGLEDSCPRVSLRCMEVPSSFFGLWLGMIKL